ncbi:MAG TPA: hypothetical protein VNA14_12355 [Mycobacteriales bacterium]|nr:hypothetical protein [Mycobacteriales bacterium]
MRRLLALAFAGAAAFSAPAAADPTHFPRRCEGKVDAFCHDQFCGIIDCITRDCVVYLDPTGGYNTSTCIGKARPRDSEWR